MHQDVVLELAVSHLASHLDLAGVFGGILLDEFDCGYVGVPLVPGGDVCDD